MGLKLAGSSLLALILAAGCSSTPPAEQAMIYIDPDTGEVSVPEDASDEALAVAGALGSLRSGLAEPLEDHEIWFVDRGDNYTHIQSGLICPATWSGLTRTHSTIYNPMGQDVGCNYARGDDAIVTFYAYRNGQPVEQEVEQLMAQVVKTRHPVFEESDLPLHNSDNAGMNLTGDAITFQSPQGVPMKSGVAVMDSAGWRVKARITYTLAIADEIESFVSISMMGQHERILDTKAHQDAPPAANADTL